MGGLSHGRYGILGAFPREGKLISSFAATMHINHPNHTTVSYWYQFQHHHVGEPKNWCRCDTYLQDDDNDIIPTVDRGEHLCDLQMSC